MATVGQKEVLSVLGARREMATEYDATALDRRLLASVANVSMIRSAWTGTKLLLFVLGAACAWLLVPADANAVGIAYCFIEHGKAGDDVEYRTTVKYALMVRDSRSEAKEVALAEVARTLQRKYSHLIGKSVYEHGESIAGPECDTWAFTSGYWTLIETRFSNSSYAFHTIVAGVGTTEATATANAIKNLELHNWSWSQEQHSYAGLEAGSSGNAIGDLAIGDVDPP